MASPERLAELRGVVRQNQRLVRAKMLRATRKGRVDWELGPNIKSVPLTDRSKFMKYTEKQLLAQIGRQKQFLDRNNILVADSRGKILPSTAIRVNRKLERQWAAKAQSEWLRYKDVPAYDERWGETQTLEDIRIQRTPNWGLGSKDASKYTGNAKVRKSYGGVKDAKALEAINKALLDKLRPDYFERQQGKQLETIKQQLSIFGDIGIDIYDKVADLDGKALNLLLADNRFWASMSANYERIKSGYMLTDDDSVESQVLKGEFHDINRRLNWARNKGKLIK